MLFGIAREKFAIHTFIQKRYVNFTLWKVKHIISTLIYAS